MADNTSGLKQPESQNPVKKEENNSPLPPSLRGHKTVPAHPYAAPQNSAYSGDASAKPKTMEQCVTEHKARLATKK